MHIVLIEPHFAGHRPTYLYQYSKLLIELGHRVTIICEETEKCANFINIEKQLGVVTVLPLTESINSNKFLSKYSFYNTYVFWKRLKLTLKKLPTIDFVFFMYLDFFLFNFNKIKFNRFIQRLKPSHLLNKYMLPMIIKNSLKVKWSGLLFHSSHFKHPDYKYFFRSTKNNSIAVLDETYDLNFEVKKKYVFPDITDEETPLEISELAKSVLKKANGRKVISLLGSLEKRKGILPLLELTQQMDPTKYFFLIAGKLDITFNDNEKQKIQQVQQLENCHVIIDGIPTEGDFNSLVKITDILYVVYLDFFHSSNLLTKAGLFKKPVISLQGHCIGKRVKKYNLGVTIDGSSVSIIKNALENFDILYDQSKNRFMDYFYMHSQVCLKKSLKYMLEN